MKRYGFLFTYLVSQYREGTSRLIRVSPPSNSNLAYTYLLVSSQVNTTFLWWLALSCTTTTT